QDPLLAGEAPGGGDGVVVGDGDDLVVDGGIEHGRHEAGPDPLLAVRARLPAGEDGALGGLDGHDVDLRLALAQVSARSGDRASRSDAGDEDVHAPLRVLPDLRARRAVMDGRVVGVVELARHPRAVAEALADLFRTLDRAPHPSRAFGQDHDPAQRSQHVAPLDGHGVRHGEDAAEAEGRCGEGDADPRVAARRLHDHLPGSELTPLDRGFQHGDPDAVLDRIVRVEPLVFDDDGSREPFSHATEPDERRAAVGSNDPVVDLAAIPEATGRVVAPRGAPVVEPSARHGSSRSCVGSARPCTGCDPHRERRSRTANGTNGGGAAYCAGPRRSADQCPLSMRNHRVRNHRLWTWLSLVMVIATAACSGLRAAGAADLAPTDGDGAPRLRTLVLMLDGVPYTVVDSLWRAGHFADFRPPSKVISTFPALTEVAFGSIWHERPQGYEDRYFNTEENRIEGGLLEHLFKPAEHGNFRRHVDIGPGGVSATLAYVFPTPIARRELDRLRDRLLEEAPRDTAVVAYLMATDAIAHRSGREELVRYLLLVEQFLEELRR